MFNNSKIIYSLKEIFGVSKLKIKIAKLSEEEFKTEDELNLYLGGILPVRKGYFLMRSERKDVNIDQPHIILFHYNNKIFGEGIAYSMSDNLGELPNLPGEKFYYDKDNDKEKKYAGIIKFLPESLRVFKNPISKDFLNQLGYDLANQAWNIVKSQDYIKLLGEVAKTGGFANRFTIFD